MASCTEATTSLRPELVDPAVAEVEDLGEVVPGVDVHHRERDARRARTPSRQAQHHDGVLAAGEQQHGPLELGGDLADDVDAPRPRGRAAGSASACFTRVLPRRRSDPPSASRLRSRATSAGWQTRRSGDHGFGPVVDERRSVEPTSRGARRPAPRRPAPPSPTRTGRRRGRRRRRCPSTTAMTLTPVEPIGTSSTSAARPARCPTKAGGPGARDRDPQRPDAGEDVAGRAGARPGRPWRCRRRGRWPGGSRRRR